MTVTIGRRELLAALGGAAVAWPLAARGQEVAPGAARSVDRPARIAVISFIGPTMAQPYWREFRNGLRALGWIEGRNVTIAERFAEGEDERLPVIVDDIVAMKPEVIVIDGARVVRAFRERTAAIPIVTSVVSDPVGSGFITSFARPGGNVTGMAFQEADLITKRAELPKELAKRAAINHGLIPPLHE